jgi:hypothetical protein
MIEAEAADNPSGRSAGPERRDVQNAFIRDEDGTFLGGEGGAVLARAELFSNNSFFGIPYADPVNRPPDQPFWYPNLPAVMRSDRYICIRLSHFGLPQYLPPRASLPPSISHTLFSSLRILCRVCGIHPIQADRPLLKLMVGQPCG